MRTMLIAISMAGATIVPAAAQSPHAVIAAPADQPYAMRHSKLTVPPVLDGMRRMSIRQLGDGEVDVYAVYENAADAITVYAYRNVVGSVPVWFDRARAAVEERVNVYGAVTAAGPPVAFTPPGQNVASGLVGAWTITKPPYRGTALALLPMNGWLVKVRYSSTTLDGPAVAARIPAVLAALSWPNEIAKEAVAAPVAGCATPLAFPKRAKAVRTEGDALSASLLGGVLAAARSSRKTAATPSTVSWCRDPAPAPIGAVYRADGDTDGYLLAFSDAGRAVGVQPDHLGAMLGKGKAAPRWAVTLYDMTSESGYPAMTALPRPDQLMQALNGPAVTRAQTWPAGSQNTVNVNIDAVR